MSIAPIDLANLPPELILGEYFQQVREAEMTGIFLEALSQTPGLEWLAKRPLRLPIDVLFGLGAAMRLVAWEAEGIHVHRDAGLPSAEEALRLIFQSHANPEVRAQVQALPGQVEALFREHFAWTAAWDWRSGSDWGRDVILGDANEDNLVDAMAKLLWDHRNDCPGDQD